MKMLRTLAILIFALLPCTVFAQQGTTTPYFFHYDLAATTATFGGFAPQAQGVGTVSAATNTLTADLTASTPFSQVTVGSLITLQTGINAFTTRVVTAKATSVSLTFDGAALTLTSVPWRYQVFTAGTSVVPGWLPTLNADYVEVQFDFTTMNGTGGILAVIQCQLNGLAVTPNPVYSVNIPAAATTIVPIAERCAKIRVGLNWVSSAAGTDVLNVFLYSWSSSQ